MTNLIANKILEIKPSPTLAVTAKAAELKSKGIDIISLGAGEPDFDTPENIKNAAKKALDAGQTKYTAVGGISELKIAVKEKFAQENNVHYEIDQIIVGAGAKHVIYNAFMASLNEGDEVIVPAPYWVSYPDMVKLAGGVPVVVTPSSGFKLSASEIEKKITSKTKWLILNSPSNPTGEVYEKAELLEIAELLKKYDNLHIMSDDIYEHLIYEGLEFSTLAAVAPEFKDRILTVNGVSKAYSMTGWRIGYAGGSVELIKAMTKIQSQSTSNPCSISQWAALEALEGDQSFIATNKELFQKRRDIVVEALNSIEGIECSKPGGAFYVMPSFEKLVGKKMKNGQVIENSKDFATYLLEEANVAVVPGIAFGMENHFRISYATSEEMLEIACARIKKALGEI